MMFTVLLSPALRSLNANTGVSVTFSPSAIPTSVSELVTIAAVAVPSYTLLLAVNEPPMVRVFGATVRVPVA